MGKGKLKNEFVHPTHFELILKCKNKEHLRKVVNWLLENGSSSFQWEMTMLEKGEEYSLSIQSCWADNLGEIASLLADYGQDK